MHDLPLTTDAFLGGQVMLVQPASGAHRAGSDAVFLAATLRDDHGLIADLGAGCGAVGLMAAHHNPDAEILLAENDPIMLSCCAKSMERNPTLAKRSRVLEVDILAPEPQRIACGLHRASVDHVLANPPYRKAGHGQVSAAKKAAHVISQDQLDGWIRAAASVLKPSGSLTLIFAADGLINVVEAMAGRFGAITMCGLHPQAGQPAERVLIRGIKGRKTPPQLLPGLILHAHDGAYTDEAQAVLSGKHGIAMAL